MPQGWKQRPRAWRQGLPSRMSMVVSVPGRMLKPWCSQEGCVVLRVDHDLDAGLKWTAEEVVLLLNPEDQADPWGGQG